MAIFEGKLVAVIMEFFELGKKDLRKGLEMGRFEDNYYV